jgi:hypothetical protein
MTVVSKLVEGKHALEFVVSEDNDGHLSRDQIPVAKSQTLIPGQVIAHDATGHWGAFIVGDASFGTAAAVIAYPVTTDAANFGQAVAITRAAEVRGTDLVWPNGITGAQITAAAAQLAASMIIVR